MAAGVGLNQPATAPGVGYGWTRLAEVVAQALPPAEVDGLWAFLNIRRDGREWGTAVLTRVDGASGERRRVYTARYMLVLKGKERGQFEAEVDEVGSAPLDTLAELLQEVHKRTDDEHPPVALAPTDWFPEAVPSAAERLAEPEAAAEPADADPADAEDAASDSADPDASDGAAH
jgi:hypothetical protein